MKVLGISGSLRNARYGRGSAILIEEIHAILDEQGLTDFLEQQTRLRVDEYIAAGREEKLPFDVMYRNLQRAKGDKGLSNSEAALVAGLWGAVQEGAEVAHTGLARFFPMSGPPRDLDQLKALILNADALLISGPVYFGDRGSLVQSLIEFATADDDIRAHLDGKLYAGIAVGAKRNGGQETTLIYQMVDMANLNMLTVGNSAETTSQYGGTVLAGDVGTAWNDQYGLNTAIGTGRRIAAVGMSREAVRSYRLKDKFRIGIWLVQDDEAGRGHDYVREAIAGIDADDVEFKVFRLSDQVVQRCIACDLCPTHHAEAGEYTCIIKSKDDVFARDHRELLDVDAVLLAAYSPVDRKNVKSVYQQFLERTRYIRRANYLLSDMLFAPFVISEVNANQNLHIRMLTSLIRHHTILHHPVIGLEYQGGLINADFVARQFGSFVSTAREMTIARLVRGASDEKTMYNAIGYEISAQRDRETVASGAMDTLAEVRTQETRNARDVRLEKV